MRQGGGIMRRIIRLAMTTLVISLFIGCNFVTMTSTTTTDPRSAAIEAEFERLLINIPTTLVADVYLPASHDDEIIVEYLVDGIVLIEHLLTYHGFSSNQEINLTVRLTHLDLIVIKVVVITQMKDEAYYDQADIDFTFDEIGDLLEMNFPDILYTDFTLPIFSYGSAEFVIAATKSRIVDNRFIFTFPTTRESIYFIITVLFKNQTRDYLIPLELAALNELPKIPEIQISTVNNAPIVSKDEYVSGFLTLTTFDGNLTGSTVLENVTMQIRVRGNSTAFMPKLPYKIKFTVKTALLSEYAQKDWVLLANYTDHTLIRNYLAYQMAKDIGMEFAPMAKFVDVYVNGIYQGNYMLSDQIEVSPNRIDIEEDSSDLDTGYLIEFDKRLWDFDLDTITENYFILYGIPYVIKSPDETSPNYTINHLYYIEDFLVTVINTLKDQKDYSRLIDEASFIDWFIVEEVFKNVDSGYSSVYMVKDKGGLLKMGPIWDFDLSSGNQGHLDSYHRDPEGWYTPLEYKNIYFYYLMQYPVFRTHLKARWNQLYELHILALLDQIYPAADSIARSRYLNFERWDVIGINQEWYTATEVFAAKTYEDQLHLLYQYLEVRIAWLNREINYF
jgi:hypothetical protein